MCFSASASFTASAILIPAGIYCVRESMIAQRTFLLFSLWPLLFGIQQAFEGFVWLGISNNELFIVDSASFGFLFFSHFFWLFWTPLSSFYLETNRKLRIVLIVFTIIGLMYGTLLYFPLLNGNLLNLTIVGGSINYHTRFIFDGLVPKNFSFTVYAIIILVPLFISSNRRVNILGYQLGLSAIVTYMAFVYAFSSVWCFCAAILSIYIAYMINPEAIFSK